MIISKNYFQLNLQEIIYVSKNDENHEEVLELIGEGEATITLKDDKGGKKQSYSNY